MFEEKLPPILSDAKPRIFAIPLALILIIGLILRLKSIWFGYPLITHPDEPLLINAAKNILNTGDLNPLYFEYPSFVIYLQTASIALITGFNYIFFNVSATDIPSVDFYIAGRAIASIAATLSIFITYNVGRMLFNSEVGLFASGLVAVSPIHIQNSALVTTDIWVSIFSTFILLYCAKLYHKPETKYYLLAGGFAGFAASSKYTAVVFASAILLAHLASRGFSLRNLFDRNLFVAAASTVFTFLLTTPYAILDAKTFLSYVEFQKMHYSTGHLGAEAVGDSSYDLYAKALVSPDGLGYIATILAMMSIFFAFRKSYRSIIFVLILPISLFLLIGNYKVFFARNIVGAIPALSITAAFTIYATSQSSMYLSQNKRVTSFLYCFLFFVITTPLAIKALDDVKQKQLSDTRWISLNWIKDNIPVGSKIAIEGYAPPVTQLAPRFVVVELGIAGLVKWTEGIAERPTKRKVDESIQYVILSSFSYDRFFDHTGSYKEMYKEEAQIYTKYFNSHRLVYELKPQAGVSTGPVIRIYENRETTQ